MTLKGQNALRDVDRASCWVRSSYGTQKWTDRQTEGQTGRTRNAVY